MSNCKEKVKDRILAAILVIVMLTSIIPITVFASTPKNPGVFTFTVENTTGDEIDEATIDYDIKVNGVSEKTGLVVTADGEAVISDMADYADTISAGVDTVSIDYTVSKSGYTDKIGTETVSDDTGNISVVLAEVPVPPEQVTVTVNPTENGVVKLNGAETNSVTVDKGSNVSVEITPNEGYQIASVSIGGTAQAFSPTGFSKTIEVESDTIIEVSFVRVYTFSVSSNDGGKVFLDDEMLSQKKYDENSEATIKVTPNTGYQIASVSIGGVAEPISDVTNFSKTVIVSSDIAVVVSFVKVYTITVLYNSAGGEVITNPICKGGKVTVNIGTKVELTATPNATYRVSKIVVNDDDIVFDDNTYDNKNPYTNTYTADKDYLIEITFAPLVYNVTSTVCTNGSISISTPKVDYDGSTTVHIYPAVGYTVDTVKVNGVDTAVNTPDDTKINFNIANIKEDKEITVTFKKVSSANMSDVSFNYTDAVRANNDGTFYVFREGTKVTFTTTKGGIRINGQGTGSSFMTQSVTIETTTSISKIELYYRATGDLIPAWHTVSTATENNPLKIAIDITNPSAKLTPASANVNGYYNSNVSVTVEAEDTGDYSGIEKVEYKILCDGKVTGNKTLYTYEAGNEVLSMFNRNIIVPATTNNSDNVVVELTVTDRAGNTATDSKTLKINETKPTVGVSIDGTLHNEATEGYYNTQRTATITFTDRKDTFVKFKAEKCIKINETEVNTANIEWIDNADNEKKGIYEAKIKFSETGSYKFDVDSYTNEAGLTSDKPTISGDSAAEFMIDMDFPSGNISIDEHNKWSGLLSTLTFGIWRNNSITVTASGDDITSPIYDVLYYKSNSNDEVLNFEGLEKLYKDGEFVKDEFTVTSDEHFVVYARITDYAGNTSYISTDGLIVDRNAPIIVEIEAQKKPNEKGFYSKNDGEDEILFDVSVKEKEIEGVYSGIKTIEYQVFCDYDITQGRDSEDNDNGLLYSFDYDAENNEPLYADLLFEWEGTVAVSFEKNNGKIIYVKIIATDNAGNSYEEESSEFSINEMIPTIDIKIDGEVSENGKEGYYQQKRTAIVTITDEEYSFNEDGAIFEIKAVNAKGELITLNTAAMISSWSHNGNTHTTTVTFAEDGNYTWSLSYTNDADNENTEVTTGESVTPFNFTVDKTDPTGTIFIDSNSWSTLLEVLTFGLYSNVKADVTATAEDATSPVIIEYYKTDDTIIMNSNMLEDKYKDGSFDEFEAFSVPSNEKFVVYLRITDYAGKYSYISSDGYILDDVASSIELNPEEANINGFYNGDVDVEIKIEDAPPYSGIKSVEYWVQKDSIETQREKIFAFDVENPVHKDLVNEWNGTITVDSEINNSSNVVVYVKTIDNAKNEKTQSVKLDIDITAPTIDITFDNNADNNGNGYFNASRTATVVITERMHHFDAKAATDGIIIEAFDSKNQKVEIDKSEMISKWINTEGENPDDAIHTATITFDTDANYTFDISYTDMAGNKNDGVNTNNSVAPYNFTVDKTEPTGTIKAASAEGREEEWSELRENLQFGFWSNAKITISGTSDDITSPIASVQYYKQVSLKASDATEALTKAQLDEITDWTDFGEGFEVTPNEQFTVYIKITDEAGNYSYISTNGLIVDSERPIEEAIAPEITISPEQPINGLYNNDVKVSIKVYDPLVGGTYSGLKKVRYEVFNTDISETEPTQSGTLYEFNTLEPNQSELRQTFEGDIVIDSALNNGNNIKIVVCAIDNALNSSEDDKSIKIDITAPVINISYDNNKEDSNSYFKDDRTATIAISERNFNSDDVKITITNTDGIIPMVSEWKESVGTGNFDDTTNTATITYHADGDYTFAIEYTDLAGNKCTEINYDENTKTGTETAFTIDQTIPKVSVTYDNNSAENTNYYKEDRTATIVINEHNFSADRVVIALTATDDGKTASVPAFSGWTTKGDTHTGTIHYSKDSLYAFEITCTDLAGNVTPKYDKDIFYIDKTAPSLEITGVADNSANKGDVVPIITYSDTNYDDSKVKTTLVGANRKTVKFDGSFADIHNGKVFTFKNFAKEQEFDDVYTLTTTLTDKAGNSTTKTINFSVNRFGSIYSLSKLTASLNGSFVKTPIDVVVTETNANKLKNIKITLFKNDKTITLVEGNDYKIDVAGGNGRWYQYTYTIFKSNFEDDGVYRLTFHSEDAAGNIAENTLDTKDLLISFGVDKTNPNIIVSNLENGKTYAFENYTVLMTVNDNLEIDSVIVYLDGKEYKKWSAEEVKKIIADNGNYNFDIAGDSTDSHKLKIVCTDAAGNETVEEIVDFYITTNVWVRYYNNKLLFFGSIGGAVLLSGLTIFLVVFKRKRKAA